jgi:hypothetical protein
MPTSRVTPKRLPVSVGRDSRFTIRHNPDQDRAWWVYYEPPGQDPIPADHAHSELVERVNHLKEIESNSPGGGFSINEHGQVIARMKATSGPQSAWHVVDVSSGSVFAYTSTITFLQGALDPSSNPTPGTPWTGPLCGTTYTFAAPNARRPPANNLDDIRIVVNGIAVLLSMDTGIWPYPPPSGPLLPFLTALRERIPTGGRFRVNEKGRAFTSKDSIYIGIVPTLPNWFRPISPMD